MSTAPNNEKLLILAAVGVGIYLVMARRQVRAATPVTPATATANNRAAANGLALGSIASIFRTVGGWFNPNTSPQAMANAAQVGANNAISDGNYAGADWNALASSATDGVAANVPNLSTFDATQLPGLYGSSASY